MTLFSLIKHAKTTAANIDRGIRTFLLLDFHEIRIYHNTY